MAESRDAAIAALRAGGSVLLIDWEAPSVPRAFLAAGFRVFSHSPDGTSEASVVAEPSGAATATWPGDEADDGVLQFLAADGATPADLVHLFRPPEEHAEILRELVFPRSPQTVWLHPPIRSDATRDALGARGIGYVDTFDVRDLAGVF